MDESMGAIISLSLFILIAYLLAELDDTRDRQDQARLRRDVSLLDPPLAPTVRRIYVGLCVRWSGFLFFSKKLYLCGLKYICMQYIVFICKWENWTPIAIVQKRHTQRVHKNR